MPSTKRVFFLFAYNMFRSVPRTPLQRLFRSVPRNPQNNRYRLRGPSIGSTPLFTKFPNLKGGARRLIGNVRQVIRNGKQRQNRRLNSMKRVFQQPYQQPYQHYMQGLQGQPPPYLTPAQKQNLNNRKTRILGKLQGEINTINTTSRNLTRADKLIREEVLKPFRRDQIHNGRTLESIMKEKMETWKQRLGVNNNKIKNLYGVNVITLVNKAGEGVTVLNKNGKSVMVNAVLKRIRNNAARSQVQINRATLGTQIQKLNVNSLRKLLTRNQLLGLGLLNNGTQKPNNRTRQPNNRPQKPINMEQIAVNIGGRGSLPPPKSSFSLPSFGRVFDAAMPSGYGLTGM
jgi:hypothetical protein